MSDQALTSLTLGIATVVDVIDVAQRLERAISPQEHDHKIAQQWLVIEPAAATAEVAVIVKPSQRFRDLLTALGAGEASSAEFHWSAMAERLGLSRRISAEGAKQVIGKHVEHPTESSASRNHGGAQ